MSPIKPWRNSTPFFGAAALCTIKIEPELLTTWSCSKPPSNQLSDQRNLTKFELFSSYFSLSLWGGGTSCHIAQKRNVQLKKLKPNIKIILKPPTTHYRLIQQHHLPWKKYKQTQRKQALFLLRKLQWVPPLKHSSKTCLWPPRSLLHYTNSSHSG